MTLTAHTPLLLTHDPLYYNLGFRVKKLGSCIMMRQSAAMIQQTLVLWVHIAHSLGQSELRRKDVNVNTAIKLIPPSKQNINSFMVSHLDQ